MHKHTPQDALAVPCPVCHVAPGRPCLAVTGTGIYPKAHPHVRRTVAAR